MRVLDRYILDRFLRIFAVCVLGVPFLFIVIDLAEGLDRYLARGAGGADIFLHYLFQLPYQILLAFPVAALLAAVFTVSGMTRNFETTAAKAGGVSFYRLSAPLLAAAMGISFVALALTELVPNTNRMAETVIGEDRTRTETLRETFVFRGNEGRVYQVQKLDTETKVMESIRIDREGRGYEYPAYRVSAGNARWVESDNRWVLEEGRIRFLPDRETERTFKFRELWQKPFTETPSELLAEPRDPDEMGYAELGRYIEAIQRSGGQALDLIVERELKIAFPFTCFIIVLFGAPLAHSTRRGGATVSVGIALATTVFFLILIRLSQALGAGGTVPPRLAAWLPNLLFLAAGLWLMWRVRT